MELPEVCKHLAVSEAKSHRWRTRFGGITAGDAKPLKELEAKNTRLKRIVADQVFENQAPKESAKGTGEPVHGEAAVRH